MLVINGRKFYEEPTSCGTCAFMLTGNTDAPIPVSVASQRGICLLFDEEHHTWANCPRRCAKIFKKAFAAGYPDGIELVVTKN